MRVLASYIMKGRIEAAIVAVLTTGTVLFAWVGAAAVALVTLCKGLRQGSYVLFWALLPAMLLMRLGDAGPLITLLGGIIGAIVLRVNLGWPLALLAATVSGLLAGIGILTLGQASIDAIVDLLANVLGQLSNTSDGEPLPISLPSSLQIAGLLGFGQALTISFCLILARWWQASLYNPGGFRHEFQAFRIPLPLTLLLLIGSLLLLTRGDDFTFWALIVIVPFMFAGFSLVHAVAEKKQLSNHWLVLFYIAWLLLDPLKILLILVVVADSWFDLRARLV